MAKNTLTTLLKEDKSHLALLLTWPYESLKLLSCGLAKMCPVIAKEYSYMPDYYRYHSFPIKNFAKETKLDKEDVIYTAKEFSQMECN